MCILICLLLCEKKKIVFYLALAKQFNVLSFQARSVICILITG